MKPPTLLSFVVLSLLLTLPLPLLPLSAFLTVVHPRSPFFSSPIPLYTLLLFGNNSSTIVLISLMSTSMLILPLNPLFILPSLPLPLLVVSSLPNLLSVLPLPWSLLLDASLLLLCLMIHPMLTLPSFHKPASHYTLLILCIEPCSPGQDAVTSRSLLMIPVSIHDTLPEVTMPCFLRFLLRDSVLGHSSLHWHENMLSWLSEIGGFGRSFGCRAWGKCVTVVTLRNTTSLHCWICRIQMGVADIPWPGSIGRIVSRDTHTCTSLTRWSRSSSGNWGDPIQLIPTSLPGNSHQNASTR